MVASAPPSCKPGGAATGSSRPSPTCSKHAWHVEGAQRRRSKASRDKRKQREEEEADGGGLWGLLTRAERRYFGIKRATTSAPAHGVVARSPAHTHRSEQPYGRVGLGQGCLQIEQVDQPNRLCNAVWQSRTGA